MFVSLEQVWTQHFLHVFFGIFQPLLKLNWRDICTAMFIFEFRIRNLGLYRGTKELILCVNVRFRSLSPYPPFLRSVGLCEEIVYEFVYVFMCACVCVCVWLWCVDVLVDLLSIHYICMHSKTKKKQWLQPKSLRINIFTLRFFGYIKKQGRIQHLG